MWRSNTLYKFSSKSYEIKLFKGPHELYSWDSKAERGKTPPSCVSTARQTLPALKSGPTQSVGLTDFNLTFVLSLLS